MTTRETKRVLGPAAPVNAAFIALGPSAEATNVDAYRSKTNDRLFRAMLITWNYRANGSQNIRFSQSCAAIRKCTQASPGCASLIQKVHVGGVGLPLGGQGDVVPLVIFWRLVP